MINDAATFRLWLPPDNTAFNFDVTGGVTLPKRHKLTASLSTGNMKMDHGAPANISTNPNLQTSATAPNPLYTVVPPYGSVEAEYDTFMGAVKFTGDPRPSGSATACPGASSSSKDKTEEYTLHQHGPWRRGCVLQRRPASRAST